MNKLLFRTLILSVIALATAPVLSNQVKSSEPNPTPLSLSWFSEIIFRKKPPIEPRKGGSRPTVRDTNAICMISPDAPQSTRIIWSDRPLFIWQGKVKNIVVLNKSTGKKWSQPVSETENISTYIGDEPLQPGQTYEWRVFFKDDLSLGVSFQVMEIQQRDRITADLHNLEKQLKAKGQNMEAIALAKAKYFAEFNLWSDVLQQVYSIQTTSTELDTFRQDINQKLCNSSKGEA